MAFKNSAHKKINKILILKITIISQLQTLQLYRIIPRSKPRDGVMQEHVGPEVERPLRSPPEFR